MDGQQSTAPAGADVVDLDARDLATRDAAGARTTLFEYLQRGAIVVLRNMPEIHRLGATIKATSARFSNAVTAEDIAELMRTREVTKLDALSALYRGCRHLRNTRYISALFADRVGSAGLPTPILVDSAFFRMGLPTHYDTIVARPDLFDPDPLVAGPNDAEPSLQGFGWGHPHRDVDVRHHHFQFNFWFPLHDLDQNHSLLFFPESYRRDVPQYEDLTQPENPDSWGYGKALQIPLRFGDSLVFHSQHFHASPYLGPKRNRFTVEMRVAAGCNDDNSTIYRRLFWSLGNVQPAAAAAASAVDPAAELAEPIPALPSADTVVKGATAQAVFLRLFADAADSFAAAYVHRPDAVLKKAHLFDAAAWRQIVDRLGALPTGEDLWLAVARILLAQGHRELAADVLSRTYGRTKSYFWALEAGRIAADAGLYDAAEAAFTVAGVRAASSDVALDRYTPNMPPPRGPHMLQLLPAVAKRAATAFTARVRKEKMQSRRTTPTFDHRLFWTPYVVASFDHFDILDMRGLFVALPVNRAFRPEQILDDPGDVVVAETTDGLAVGLKKPLGAKLAEPRRPQTMPTVIGDYLLWHYLNGWYLIPKRLLPFDPLVLDLARTPGVFTLDPAADPQVLYAMASVIAEDHERLTQENLDLREALERLRQGAHDS